ncbi:MAG: hypothetical protein AAFP86_12990 [Planctomycetota bacterium]
MGATKIMVIRHAEKPDTYDLGSYASGAFAGVDLAGDQDAECLVTLGWQRAGALVTLFAPPFGPPPGLAQPEHLFAADPTKASKEPSQRPFETITAVADRLRLDIDTSHSKKHYADAVKAALACDGVVLISWQHQDVPWTNADGDPGISQEICTQTGTTAPLEIPTTWPSERYDLVWVFDRPSGAGPVTSFTQIPQQLLAGDLDSGIGPPFAGPGAPFAGSGA